MEFLKALFFGVLEGITEWLPVSSTGHLILFSDLFGDFLRLRVGEAYGAEFTDAVRELFDVTVQLGAILAVAARYRDRLFPMRGSIAARRRSFGLYGRLVLSGIPAAAVGLFGDALLTRLTGKDLDAWLFHGSTVAAALIVYGLVFLIPEGRLPRLAPPVSSLEELGGGRAILIGLFQALAIVPGTSRSGATILGGTLLGLPRNLAAEYSFLLAVPTMAGASVLKALRFAAFVRARGIAVPADVYGVLLLGSLTAFLVSLPVLGFLTDLVKRHSFRPFGVYRILLGVAVLSFGRG